MTSYGDDPLVLDWGQATVELSHSRERLAVHVLNHRLASEDDDVRTLRFLRARLRWYGQNLPQGFRQRVVIDDRGQSVPASTKLRLRNACADEMAEASFLSEAG